MSDQGSAQHETGPEQSKHPDEGGKLRTILVLCGGALLTALLVAYTLGLNPSFSTDSALAPIKVSELDAAASSLYNNQAAQRIADAKTCKAPLAILTLVKKAGSPDATIRIGSGEYVSPPFLVTSTPQQVAIPFPAPYPVGKGVISVMGEGKDISVWMTPGWTIPSLTGIASHNVHWDTKPNC